MPIRFNKDFFKYFKTEDLKKIKKYRLRAITLTTIGLALNIFIYIAVTYFGFIYWGIEGYFYDYFIRRTWIDISYFLSWIAIYFAAVCLILHTYLLKFPIKEQIEILRARENQDLEKLEDEAEEFKKIIFYRMISQFSLIITMIFELNYYPRNTELFYPYIGCNAKTGICVITSAALLPFIFIMTSILVILLLFYVLIISLNIKETLLISRILNPNIEKKDKKESEKRDLKRRLTLEERKKLKLEQLRADYKEKVKKNKESRMKKYKDLFQKEKFGKKGFKKVKKEEKLTGKKEIKDVKDKKKEDYDFT